MDKQTKRLLGIGAAIGIGALIFANMGSASAIETAAVKTGDIEGLGVAVLDNDTIVLDLPRFTFVVTEIVNNGISSGEISYNSDNRIMDAVAINAYVVAKLPDYGLDYERMTDEDKDQVGEALRDVLKHYFDAADVEGVLVDPVKLSDYIRDHHGRALDEQGIMSWNPKTQDYSELTKLEG